MKNPLESLVVNQSDVPRLQKEQREALREESQRLQLESQSKLLRKRQRQDRLHKIRRVPINGAVIDIIGERDRCRVSIGSYGGVSMKRDEPNYLFSISRTEMETLLMKWCDAVGEFDESLTLLDK